MIFGINFEITLVVFIPNITTNLAITYTNNLIGILVQETVVFLVQKVPLVGCLTIGKELVFLPHKVL